MNNKWTKQQLKAINHRGGSILVSAAAGSGKTAVLVQRVINKITDEKNPVDIDKFLIVTFTKAAAAEMREKISKAINTHKSPIVKKQAYLLGNAQITTIHSFCKNLISEYAYTLGISSDFRIADTNEIEILKEKVMEQVFETCFETVPNFREMLDKFNDKMHERTILDNALKFYDKIQSKAKPFDYLDLVLKDYENFSDISSSKWGKYIITICIKMLENYKVELQNCICDMEIHLDVYKAYAACFLADVVIIDEILEIMNNGTWDEISQKLAKVSHQRLGSLRGYDDKDYISNLKMIRDGFKKELANIVKKYFSQTQLEIIKDVDDIKPALAAFCMLIKNFSLEFSKQKLEKNILDFNDLEHLTIKILDENKQEISKKFHEIMIDEYQDSNAVQDYIFNSLSNDGNNLFMVGDVKQSIYKFREALPAIFLEKYINMPHINDEIYSGKVVLSKNFRSCAQVLDTTNGFFENIMSKEFGGLDYGEEEFLYKGAEYEFDEKNDTEIYLIEANNDENMVNDDESDDLSEVEVEANFVAKKIADMIKSGFKITDSITKEKREIRSGDFCIIMRSEKNKAEFFARALSLAGIDVQSRNKGGLLENLEIRAIVSLLMAINNPSEDIYLISSLRSLLFRFSDDELANIRTAKKGVSFYDAICAMSDEKCINFVKMLEEFRILAIELPVYELLWNIYTKTDATSIYPENTLMKFLMKTREFEKCGYKGINAYINMLKKMLEKGKDFDDANPDNVGVKIMTIHKSKGLEFPVVFLCQNGKKFNKDDEKKRMIINNDLGFGVKCIDKVLGIQYSNIIRDSIIEKNNFENLEEEIRVLYVAFTRAKEKLIITSAVKNAEDMLRKWKNDIISPWFLSKKTKINDWIMPIFIQKNYKKIEIISERSPIVKMPVNACDTKEKEQELCVNPYNYIDNDIKIPEKVIATEIGKEKLVIFKKPKFGNKTLTKTEIGIAHHVFMQYCNFENCENDISAEIERLVDNNTLDPMQAEVIDASKIMNFFTSDIYKRIKNSESVYREYKFSCMFDIKDIYPEYLSDDEILVQGIMDLIFLEDGKMVVLDYKTDRFDNDKEVLYKNQMEIYRKACSKIFNVASDEAVLYFIENKFAD